MANYWALNLTGAFYGSTNLRRSLTNQTAIRTDSLFFEMMHEDYYEFCNLVLMATSGKFNCFPNAQYCMSVDYSCGEFIEVLEDITI